VHPTSKLVADLTARGVVSSLFTADHTCRQSEEKTLEMTSILPYEN